MKKLLPFTMALYSATVFAGENIGVAYSELSYFDKMQHLLQSVVNLIDGPFGKAGLIISLVLSLVLWNIAPGRTEIVGKMCRWVVAALVVLNVGTLLTWLTG